PPSGVSPNADINGGSRLTFAPYRVNALNPLNLDLQNGLTFTNIREFIGPMRIRTDCIATEIMDFTDGAVVTFSNIVIQPSATSTIPLFNVRN
ncbi:hypothetical protein ABK046_46085, partial [Streptomyces caeruleatus]